ncbi:hypothetical protein Ndes2526B_g08937 [Nannochloris sp. 'desiccata']
MARGDAKRKRENRALRAQAEKKHLDPAVLLDRGKKNSKKKTNPDNMPASLRKMLQLKAAAEGKPPPPSFQPQKKSDSNPEDVRNKPLSENKGDEIADVTAEDGKQLHEQQPGMPNKKRGPDNALPLLTGPQKPSLKARKKNFLNKKKLRKKGKYISSTAGSDSGEESDPELRLRRTALATKPKFAEQASAPMQVNLKRKHWKEDGRTNSDRCNEIFARQMNNARKQQAAGAGSREHAQKAVKEAERVEVIEAYRMKKKGNATGATLQSLADLVKKDHVSTM